MANRIYVGNLPSSVTEAEVTDLFSEFGAVEWVQLLTAVDTGRSRGRGFVGMSSGARKATRDPGRRRLGGRSLQVRPALGFQPRDASRPRLPKRARVYRASLGR
ncbi:MAG: RNA-binding protein [bacterium]|nr:RNA-binding protein [bacterium]